MILNFWNAWLLQMSTALAQSEEAAGMTKMQAATEHQANFQPYIFLAYGLACLLLLIFSIWTFLETKKLERKLEYLKERFLRAHPDALDDHDG